MVKSLYRRGADNGLIFGIYLSVMSILLMLSVDTPNLSIPALVMIAGIPFLIFYFLRKLYKDEFGYTKFSSLWMLGILVFLFGSLICGVVTYIYLQFIQPDYIYDMMNTALDLAKSNPPSPQNDQLVNILDKAIKEKMIPSPIELVIQMIWFSSFAGSILSIILAGIVKAFKVKQKTL